jgi:phage terminase small subunit
MSNVHRLFGPRSARTKPAPGKAARRDAGPIARRLAKDLGQDPEAAERNAQSIAQVLKRALRRRKAGGSSHGEPRS